MSLNELSESASGAVYSALQPRVWDPCTPMGWQQRSARDGSGTSPGSPFGGRSPLAPDYRLGRGRGPGRPGAPAAHRAAAPSPFIAPSEGARWVCGGERALEAPSHPGGSGPRATLRPLGSGRIPAKFLSRHATGRRRIRSRDSANAAALRNARAVPCRPAAPPVGCRRGRSAPPGPQRSPQPEPRGPAGPLERGRPRQRRPRLRAALRRGGGGAAAGRAAGRGGPGPLLFPCPCRGRAPRGRAAGPERSELRAGQCRARGRGRGRPARLREGPAPGAREGREPPVGSAGNAGGGRRGAAGGGRAGRGCGDGAGLLPEEVSGYFSQVRCRFPPACCGAYRRGCT